MTYLQLRITLDPSGNRSKERVYLLLKNFISQWLLPHQDGSGASYMTGLEKLNKFGEPCDEHFHLNAHFDPTDLRDPLRSAKNWLRKKALESDFSLKGNKVWSCTIVDEPNDWERWIRYPLKEKPLLPLCHIGISEDYAPEGGIEQLARDAMIERKRGVELNVIKREKAMDKQSFKDKLFNFLDSQTWEPSDMDHQTIWCVILEFYTQQGKSVCFKTISGYTTLYQLYKGLLTTEQCYVMRSNPQ